LQEWEEREVEDVEDNEFWLLKKVNFDKMNLKGES
tara:strand:+ start:363 stop:467 length:105 start_codon:yes stop_codon:yes gene_type:complete